MPEETTLWYTRCPVPSASGVAIARRMLESDLFGDDTARWRPVTEAPCGAEAHFTHELRGLFREGGNVPAIAAFETAGRSVLLALTFVPELQAIVVPAESPIDALPDLAGRRFALPRQQSSRIDFYRAMALRGIENALTDVSMSVSDLTLIDVARDAAVVGDPRGEGYDAEMAALADGRADAAYVKGSRGADLLASGRVRRVWSADGHSSLASQINNGTPRAITADRRLMQERPELAVRYLRVLIEAAVWARDHGGDVIGIVSTETGATRDGVRAAYGEAFGGRLLPSLRPELIEALDDQKRFLHRHGFIHQDFQLSDWMDSGPLEAALRTAYADLDRGEKEKGQP